MVRALMCLELILNAVNINFVTFSDFFDSFFLTYSPLHNVKPNTMYPAVLFTTGANDPRVAPWQSRKFAAAVQDASTSGYPVLLLTRMNAGHGIGAPFSQRVGNAALSMTFFATELGLGE